MNEMCQLPKSIEAQVRDHVKSEHARDVWLMGRDPLSGLFWMAEIDESGQIVDRFVEMVPADKWPTLREVIQRCSTKRTRELQPGRLQ